MPIFKERLHGYILEKLGIYDWEFAPIGKVIMSEESIETLRNADPAYIDAYDDEFIVEAYNHFKDCLGELDYDIMMNVYKKIVGERFANEADSDYAFFNIFVDGIILGGGYKVSDGINELHIDNGVLGMEVNELKRKYRGSLRTNRQRFVDNAYHEILEECFYEQCYCDYGIVPHEFDIVDIKVLDDDTVDVIFDVELWLSNDTTETVKNYVAEECIKGLLKEITVEGIDQPVWEDAYV